MIYKRIFLVLLFACLCMALVNCNDDKGNNGNNNDDNLPPDGTTVGKHAYDFTLLDQNNNPVSLYSYKGNVVLIDMSAMWCGPCQVEASKAEALYQQYRNQGFQILTVLIADENDDPCDQADLQRWANTYGLTFPVLNDADGSVWDTYGEGYIPLNIILDQRLVIRYKDSGYNETTIRNWINSLL